MNVFSVLKVEVDYGVVSDLSDEGVGMGGTLVEKFFGQAVYELVQGFDMKRGVQKVNRGSLWKVTYNPKTFRLKSLEVTVVGVRSVAPNWSCVCKNGTDQ